MGRRLALVNSVPLYLDVSSGFEGDYFRRTYGLNKFNITGRAVARVRQPQWKRRAAITVNGMLPFRYRRYFRESGSQFDQRYLDLRVARSIFLEGYWQDEQYFSDIRPKLKDELTFRQRHQEQNEGLAREIRKSESVAVHVRRLHGVPAGCQEAQSAIRSLPIDYYFSAFREIRERTRNPKFYLFSDSRFHLFAPAIQEDVIQVSNEGENAQFEDLWLMSQCRHFILANSTFSWWAAWLGRTPESIVISPVMHEWNQIVKLPDEWRSIQWPKNT
ncbi:MAG TPA: alpha-1,2-fucosyltransferase [Bryobacteraceae bacterium]|nr:alpha-1,2-fucosyltransferase [Bryobacteraceae bacterium]